MREPQNYESDKEQETLAAFLRHGTVYPHLAGRDLEAWEEAQRMFAASDLLDACRYALTLYDSLSGDDFRLGGDAPARNILRNAVRMATQGVHTQDQLALQQRCAADVKSAVNNNQARVL